ARPTAQIDRGALDARTGGAGLAVDRAGGRPHGRGYVPGIGRRGRGNSGRRSALPRNLRAMEAPGLFNLPFLPEVDRLGSTGRTDGGSADAPVADRDRAPKPQGGTRRVSDAGRLE